jgi:hypothetical protein
MLPDPIPPGAHSTPAQAVITDDEPHRAAADSSPLPPAEQS